MSIFFAISISVVLMLWLGHIVGSALGGKPANYAKPFALAVIAIAGCAWSAGVFACDCTKPANYGNPVCAAQITAALNAKPTSAVSSNANASANSSSTSKATGGSVSGVSAAASVGPVNNSAAGGAGGSASQSQRQAQGQTQSADNAGNSQATTIESTYQAARIPVSTAYSAALTSGIDTCLGSASAGAQTGILGLTLGSTRRDKTCEFIKKTHLVGQFSAKAGCQYMVDHDADIAKAMREAGVTCEDPAPVAAVPAPVTPEVPVAVSPVVQVSPVTPAVSFVTPPVTPVKRHLTKRKAASVTGCKAPS